MWRGRTAARSRLAAAGDAQGTYRSDAWNVAHRLPQGDWQVTVEASTDSAVGQTAGRFPVVNSTSETLLAKYGFWLDPPSLRGIQPTIGAEQGDAQNGRLSWGGVMPALHILPANWVELAWRAGDYNLDSPEAVRRFVLEEIGVLGFAPVRAIGPFERTTFQALGCMAGRWPQPVQLRGRGLAGLLRARS
ncbi:MAG: hypothetical protein R2844_11815 [Caldilineales bacterium]